MGGFNPTTRATFGTGQLRCKLYKPGYKVGNEYLSCNSLIKDLICTETIWHHADGTLRRRGDIYLGGLFTPGYMAPSTATGNDLTILRQRLLALIWLIR